MRKSIFKRLAALGVCCLLATTAAFAAGVVSKQVTIQYMGIKLVVDSVEVTPRDANGSVIEPLVYNGTTYLPLRAVGNAIGKQVTWDGNSKTVYLGDAPNARKWLMDLCPPYETDYGYYSANGDSKDGTNTFKMAGETYTHGFKLAFCSEDVGTDVLFNLNGKYENLDFDLGAVDDKHGFPLLLKVYLDGELTNTIEMDCEELPKHISIDLDYALQLKLEARSADGHGMWGTEFGFANARLS